MPAVPPNDKAITDLQRQLVLAQVRILELEDIRADAGTRLAQLDRLLDEMQAKANQALGEHDQLQSAHREMLAHRDHIQHLLHLANQALAETRGQVNQLQGAVEAAAGRERELQVQLSGLLANVGHLEQRVSQLQTVIQQWEARGRDLESQIASLTQTARDRLERINQLDAELKAMKASRSWRWTKWLRSLERLFRGLPPPS